MIFESSSNRKFVYISKQKKREKWNEGGKEDILDSVSKWFKGFFSHNIGVDTLRLILLKPNFLSAFSFNSFNF